MQSHNASILRALIRLGFTDNKDVKNASIAHLDLIHDKEGYCKYKKGNFKFIRSLVILFSKNFIPESDTPAIYQLFHLLNYEEHGSKEQKKDKKKESASLNREDKSITGEQVQKELKRQIQAITDQQHPLQLFNHLHGNGPTWLVIPYEFNQNDFSSHGTIKLLYDPFQKKILKFLFGVNDGNAQKWSFSFYQHKDKLKLSIFADRGINKDKINNGKKNLALKLEKYNIKIDDNIYNFQESDGFGAEISDSFKMNKDFGPGIDISL